MQTMNPGIADPGMGQQMTAALVRDATQRGGGALSGKTRPMGQGNLSWSLSPHLRQGRVVNPDLEREQQGLH